MLDAALAAFSELGYDGASTRAIAARAGVNQGLIPYYFGTKEALWQAAVDRAFSELREVYLPSSAPGEEADLRAGLIRRFVRFCARRPEFTRLMTDEGKRDGPRMHWIVDRHVRPITEAVRAAFGRGHMGAGLPADLDPLQFHYILVGAATHLFHQAPEFARLSGTDPTDESIIRAQEDALIALFATPQT